MIFVTENEPATAWKAAFVSLYQTGIEVEFNGFYKNACAAVEIRNPLGRSFSPYFPMANGEIIKIATFLVSGNDSDSISHDWTKLYRQRLFEGYNEIGQIIDLLKAWPDCPRAQIAVWNNLTDKKAKVAPCLQLLWFKLIDNSLDLHVHMRTSDCYGKFLMNINEFIAVHQYVASQLGKNIGVYRHFVDSLHFHIKDKDEVDKLFFMMESEK